MGRVGGHLPLYEYQCGRCGRFEVIRKFSDEPLTTCPTCGQEVQKLLSAPAIQFKGTGWYITDYARKSSGGGEASTKDGGKDAGRDTGKAAASKESAASKDKATGGGSNSPSGESSSTTSKAAKTS